jgi:hypothetical protein
MVPRKPQVLLLTLLLTCALSLESATAAGRSTTTPVNTILNGKGAPKSSLGIDGDFYIDVRSLLIYGPKKKGKWPTPQNLQGPTGASGSDGRNGVDGKNASTSNVNSVTGPQGPQGAVGPQGEKGEKGEAGLPGAMGPAGLSGTPGPAGVNGSNGALGPQGPVGATGASGAVGPSEVSVVDIPQFTLGTSVGYTFIASESFGILKANNSYKFDIFVRASSNILGLVLGADVLAAGGVLNFNAIRSDFRNVNYSSAPATYGFLISGTIQISGSDSSLVLRIIDAYGDSGAAPLTFSGKAYITLVGAIK